MACQWPLSPWVRAHRGRVYFGLHLFPNATDLIDTVGEDKAHLLASLMEVIGVLIEQYEDQHVPELTEG